MTNEELHAAVAEAARKVPVRLGPNGTMMVEMGQPIHLNFTESEKIADAVVELLTKGAERSPDPTDAAETMSTMAVDETVEGPDTGTDGEPVNPGLFWGLAAELPEGFPHARIRAFLKDNEDVLGDPA